MRIAIIGGIGSGKSEVVKVAREAGIFCLSADEINADLLKSQEYISKIAAIFPTVVKDGEVDKKALAHIVFQNDEMRKKLNSIAHPEIMSKIRECDISPLVCELPLYIEGGDRAFDEVILVHACLIKRIKRLKCRGLSNREAIARIRSQASESELKKYATYVLNNNGSIERLRADARCLFDELLSK